MKHLFTFLLVAISATSFAQGNLQFNDVISFSGTTYGTQTIQLDTVAVDKVIKVTSLNVTANYAQIIINNITNSYGSSLSDVNFPIWLKEGDILGIQSTWNGNYNYHISGIEFNIVE